MKWFVFGRKRTRRAKKRTKAQERDYAIRRIEAKALVMGRIAHFNVHYGFSFNKVFIKDTVTRWGSCSSKGNLNFSHRILDLPQELQDYLVVHELCHLGQMNHGPNFWALVAEQVPDYKRCAQELRAIRLH